MRICPKCRHEPVHQVPFRLFDYLFIFFQWGSCPYQCAGCGYRFWKPWTWVGHDEGSG